MCEIREISGVFLHRWTGLYGPRIAMARLDPRDDVLRRGHLLSAFRAAKECICLGKGLGRSRDHYRRGAGCGTSVKSAIPDMGLPECSAELSRADLSALLPSVDSGRAWWHGAVPPYGQKNGAQLSAPFFIL